MSGKALRDLNTLLVLDTEKKVDSPCKGNLTKPHIEYLSEKVTNGQSKVPAPLTTTPTNGVECNGKNGGTDVANAEVEYVDSENLKDLDSVETSLSTLLERLDSKDWVLVCEALNNVRQISLYHKEKLPEMLGDVMKLVVKSLKNPRSAVCKTAIMTSADIFKIYTDSVIDMFDPLLFQLFLKSSQDKRFVCEAAEKTLITMTAYLSSSLLLPKLQPYLKHRNPRIRAKASMCFCRSVPQLGSDGIVEYGIDKLIQVAASQLRDQLPESREAARNLALELQTAYQKSQSPSTSDFEDTAVRDSWESFCHSSLSPLNAQAILRVTSAAKDGLVDGC